MTAEVELDSAVDALADNLGTHLSVKPTRLASSITAPYNFQPVFWEPEKVHTFHMMCKTSSGLWTEWIPRNCKNGKVSDSFLQSHM